MGIFKLFGKKDQQKESSKDDKASSRSKRDDDSDRLAANSDERFNDSQTQQRNMARSTSMKIDAIESEMTLDILNSPISVRTPQTQPAAKMAEPAKVSDGDQTPYVFEPTLPLMEMQSTDYLLGGVTGGHMLEVEVSTSETSPEIEEVAILYANDQLALVEQMLQGAISEDRLGGATRTAWWMLFDLYQITGKQLQFDSLSIDYASKFETSPPAWASSVSGDSKKAPSIKGATPSIAFSGVLDASVSKLLDRLQKLAEKNQIFRLEFARVTAVDPVGCVLLLGALKTLRKSETELILVGAPELVEKIRAIIEVGRRDENEAPWLLFLEILQLLNREQEFEEASLDYCITFEVSPPAFEPPKPNKITTAAVEAVAPTQLQDRFTMPAIVQGNTAPLIQSIIDFAALNQRVLIDCSGLSRVDFTAAGQLLNGLMPLSSQGKTIEFQDVNHLVAALFNVMSINSIAQITPHKY